MKDIKKIQEFFSKPLEETTFKVGQKVTYLGHPAVVTATKEYNGRNYVSVSYDKGKGKTKASDILTTDGSIKPLKEMMSLDDQAKAYYLEKFKKGEISSLPEDPKAAFLAQMTKDEMEKDAAQYRRETGLEEIKKGDKVSKKYASTDEDYTKKFEVISVENGRAKVKDLKTGKITGMALSDLTTEALSEAKFTDYSNNELAAYAKELSKQRADAASKGQSDLVSGINKEIEAAVKELKKRSQKLKDLSRTDVNEAFGEKYYIMVRLKDAPEAMKAFDDFIGKNDFRINKSGDKFSTDDVKAGIRLYRHLTDRLIKVYVHNLPLEDKYLPVYEGGKWGYQEAAKNMIKFLQTQLDNMGVEYDIDPKGLQFKAIYKPENKSEEWNAKFEDLIDKANLKSLVKTGVKEISNDYSPISYAKLVAKGRMDIEDAMKETGYPYVTLMDLVKKIKAAGDSMLQEAFVPRNIAEFAERKGVSSLVKTVAGWAEKVGKRIVGGTAIGKNYDTLILDMTYQGSEIRIDTEYETVELYDEPVRTFAQFKRVYEENQEENLDEAMGGQLDEKYFIEVAVRDARKALDIYADEYSNADIETYGSNVYASNDFGDIYDLYMSLMANGIEILDSSNFDEEPFDFEDEDEGLFEADMPYNKKVDIIKSIIKKVKAQGEHTSLDDLAKLIAGQIKIDSSGKSFGPGEFKVIGGKLSEEEGYSKYLVSKDNPKGKTPGLTPDIMSKILMKIADPDSIEETKKLGENVVFEELCPKGKAYIKKRMAAGEKSSAYLSGRAVKVCKGQMKG